MHRISGPCASRCSAGGRSAPRTPPAHQTKSSSREPLPSGTGRAPAHWASAFVLSAAGGTHGRRGRRRALRRARQAGERDGVLSDRRTGGPLAGRANGFPRGRGLVGHPRHRARARLRRSDVRRGLPASARGQFVSARPCARRASRDCQRRDLAARRGRTVRHHGVRRKHPTPRARHTHGARRPPTRRESHGVARSACASPASASPSV